MALRKCILPREGFVADPVFNLIGRTALNPAFLLPLILLARYTKKGGNLAILHPRGFARLTSLFYFSLATTLGSWLSRKVQNNWTPSTKFNWPREVAVVTGGSGSIGGHIARLLAEQGATVAVLDVQPLTFEAGPNIHHFHCNITSPASVAAAAAEMRAHPAFQGREPTILVNNAGIMRGKTILGASERDVRLTFDVNTLSHYWMAQEFVPAMVKKNHGAVVTVSSYAAWLAVPNMAEYGASKSAVVAFHEGLAAELATRHNAPRVRTILVFPGKVKTPLTQGYKGAVPFLMPDLEPETVAEEVVRALMKGDSGTVTVPRVGVWLSAVRALPDWFQVKLRTRSQRLMTHFAGRQVEQSAEQEEKRRSEGDVVESSETTVLVGGK